MYDIEEVHCALFKMYFKLGFTLIKINFLYVNINTFIFFSFLQIQYVNLMYLNRHDLISYL